MKMVKGLLLGAAASIVAVAGAQAADLPVKAKPVQYVKICSLYGAGFYYIPGTDTCLKVGGWVRYEQGWGYNGSFTTTWFNNNLNNRSTNENNWRVKGVISFDAREQTEYGTLRSYATLGVSNNNIGDNGTTANYVNRWFIQWAGFTVGHASSFYDFYNTGANQYGSLTGQGPDSTDGGWDVFGYTAQFGNGLSASVAAEVQRRTQIFSTATVGGVAGAASATGLSVPSNAVGTNYRGHDYPDLVGNLRIDQAWGSAQVQAAWHQVSALYFGATEGTGYPGDKSGFAVGGGVKINTPFITKGDYFEAGVDYSEGAMRYLSHGSGVFNMAKFSGGATPATVGNLGVGFLGDAVMGGVAGATGAMDLVKGWAAEAAFTHFWTPTLKSTIWGNYLNVKYGSLGNAMMCTALGFGAGGAGSAAVATPGCNSNWDAYAIGLRTEWAATKNLSIGLEASINIKGETGK